MKAKFLLLLSLSICCQNLIGQTTWQHIESFSDSYLYRVYALSPDTIFVTGRGLIAKSTDYGNTWQRTIIPDNTLIKDIIFTDKEIGFAVGEQGKFYKTTDAGKTWELKTTNITNTLNAVAYCTADSIWAVGDEGTVILSTDKGETWESKDFSTSENLNDIKFYGAEGYIVGNNLFFYKSQDYGVTWNSESVVIKDDYRSDFVKDIWKIIKTSKNLYLLNGISEIKCVYQKDIDNWVYIESGYINSFFISNNDENKYFVAARIATNGGENYICLNEQVFFNSWWTHIDAYHSDITVVRDTMIYIISGNVMLKSSPNMPSDLKAIKQFSNKLLIRQITPNRLILKPKNDKRIISYEIINAMGKKMIKSDRLVEVETAIDISVLTNGVYLVKVILADNSTAVCKFIKR